MSTAEWIQDANSTSAAPAGGWLERVLTTDLFHGVTPYQLLLLTTVLVAGWLFSRGVQRMLTRSFERRHTTDAGTQIVVMRLVHYSIMLIAVFVALNVVGVQLTSLFAAGAAFAVVIGFAMQNLSENFVSGVILMVERSITPGDIIEVEGRVVRVTRMGIRATVARTRDDEDMIIPNSLLVRSTVKNFTLRDSNYRLRALVGVSYGSDMHAVRKALDAAAQSVPWRDREMGVRILLTEFGSSSVNFEVSVWIADPWHSRRLLSELNEALWWSLKEAGVTIAYPQMDLHLDREVLESLRALSSSR